MLGRAVGRADLAGARAVGRLGGRAGFAIGRVLGRASLAGGRVIGRLGGRAVGRAGLAGVFR